MQTPEDRRPVAMWLLVCCFLVFAMVVLGGVTRLTGSGLSMVDWRPVTGVLPPLSEAQWAEEFSQYQASPEFKKVNSHMDVDDFKGIFWLEYLHRLLGRIIGLAFFVPFMYFWIRGHIQRAEIPKYLLMFVLGGMQGVLGWYMVKSGLVDNPNVSQYRLTAHLVAAFTIYAFMLWVALSLLRTGETVSRHPWYGRALGLWSLITITVVSGGFVAGLKAGKIFNTFPKMGDSWIPDGLTAMQPFWINAFENMVTVQFNHRVLALTTFALTVLYWFFSRRENLPRATMIRTHWLLIAAIAQVLLGITTLLMRVPIALGAAHQAVGMLLFTAALVLCHGLRGNQIK